MLVPTKRAIAEALLERGSVFVHLDPRLETVHVPPFLRKQPQVVLQVGLDMPVPIPDLAIDDDGVTATLSFNRTPHRCFVPWDAVFALVGDDGRGRVFIESMPVEIKREIDREATGLEDVEREPTSAELDAMEGPDEVTSPSMPFDGNVIPLWPRSVKPAGPVAPIGVVGPVGGRRPATLPPPADPSPSLSVRPQQRPRVDSSPPRDPDKPRPPHPHLRRVK